MRGGASHPGQRDGRAPVVFDRVWKKFHKGELHDSLRDLIPAVAKRLVGRGPKRDELEKGDFWALRDVSFEVRPGEALGIIGPNGAGKSTVLKVLTRILRPNRGYCHVRGRVGALIEVAAGFHPDLTGGENIFLQGAIMGMRKEEIARKFDQIVEFAGIAEFIDTQVKRYSSGMNARLGFSIAAHLDPEVMIIDEVLAVGDFSFQKKAFERMGEIVRRDIPVVIVSHQLDRIASLCSKAILLDRGEVVARGTPTDCIAAYLKGQAATRSPDAEVPIELRKVEVDTQGEIASGDPVRFRIHGVLHEEDPGQLCVAFRLRKSETGQMVFATDNVRCEVPLPRPGPFSLEVEVHMNVAPGIYALESLVFDHTSQTDVAPGPGAYLQVRGGPSFFGVAQCMPRMEFRRARSEAAVGP